jgi:hypothetical protein
MISIVSSSVSVAKEKSVCSFPLWLNYHHDWRSIDDRSSIHVNKKGISLKLRDISEDETSESHVACHATNEIDEITTRVVAHVKSGW